MSEIAVRVEGLGKKYRVVLPQERHDTLRDMLAYRAGRFAKRVGSLGRRVRRDGDGRPDHIWALRDVSFEVARGSAVGIIGANGAGKSTLLKVLSQITSPTTGEVEIRGRVGSLLEVGTGFHSELTGRENTYLSGAILGMRRQEIDRKFDEIVDFSEVEQFIDTPVKHYSSGMYLRLAFAVAAHLEPEILIVDEVLAVGDASFQKKCLGKMSDVTGEGRTVLFVSHNMDAVQRLCSRGLLVENGALVEDGEVGHVITRYLSRNCDQASPNIWVDLSTAHRRGAGGARFTDIRFTSNHASVGDRPFPFGTLDFEMRITSEAEQTVQSLAVYIRSQGGLKLINADTVARGQPLHLREGPNVVKVHFPELNLNPGIYSIGLWLAATAAGSSALDHIESALELEVVPPASQGLGVTPGANGVVASRFEVRQMKSAAGLRLTGR
jgi:lipopolysaccharide transport system ATP-binding protein